ncbi:aminotransferase class V-fold PLP-dependent enzyme [Alkalihalobacillus sp. LMS39]|uniref:aminotransferase class V-fold PLP-dependent enzyme n=1 Tax=Alkalihalobacillus sp. LMS39 TaxID=2924032 RepID=UPI001FB330D7|nr:aminotransferase class V-fold PLP-dependent enzyme [Alkalihalobacillus sp. LMS39]UOE94131.1 aminotransferase class V-fold PLP-dependent enzyme [Alkalihalobacillus sp. LMS39]
MTYIYFDQAASSFPKPATVAEAMTKAINEYGANPGRGGHTLAVKANDVIYQTRKKLATMFGANHPNDIIFFSNATYALNQAIQGLPLKEGDHIVSTMVEHNSVRRPLEYMRKEKKIEITYVHPSEDGLVDAKDIERELTDKTVAVIVSHGSNVTGAITPVEQIGKLLQPYAITYIVDASQTAGVLPLNMEQHHIDILAFPGHKGLLGPQGTGILVIGKNTTLHPLVYGGTGSHSEQPFQPVERPHQYESGTLNTPGIAGLSAGIDEVLNLGMDSIFSHEWELTSYCLEKLNKIEGITVYGPSKEIKRLGVISFSIAHVDEHEVAMILDQHYKIAVRAGLQCSPLTHEVLGTIENGTVRVSFGPYNTKNEINRLIEALIEIKSYM